MKEAVRRFKETIEIKSTIFNRLRSHRYFSISVLVAACLFAACFHVWQRVKVIELVKEVSQLQAENKSLLDDYKKVHSDIASLSMASRIERYARDTLGLAPVEVDRLYTLVRGDRPAADHDELVVMLSAIKRVADYMPVVAETRADARVLHGVRFDSTSGQGADK
jgi:cell division protein FtsL